MDAQIGQARLARTNSTHIRSSPTARASVHGVFSVSEIEPDAEAEDLEEQKPHSKPCTPPVRSYAACFAPLLVLFSLLCVYTMLVFFRQGDISTSENLLSVLIVVAILLFLVSKNKSLQSKRFNLCKQLCAVICGKRLGLSCLPHKNHSKTVEWFIGEPSDSNKLEGKGVVSFKRSVTEGTELYSNGDFYEGEFHGGRCNGSGVYNYTANGRYEGDWVDGKYDGYGVESWARGSRYRGQYKQGLRHGYGVYKFYTGDAYAGEWCNGQSNGIGVQTCADGSCYIGEFKNGVKHGLGCYHFRNGDRYSGEYFGDKIHGFGVYQFVNGHCYEGSWHEGRKQGYGMYTFRNGNRKSGEWDDGNLRNPFPPCADSLVLQAVQAARKTAENAIRLPRVEEQVNRAVTCANRAATAARVAAVKAVQNMIHGNFRHTNV